MKFEVQASPDWSSRRFVRLSRLRKFSKCEQVAAVCYRVREGAIEFLLVQTRGSGRWTFPKGNAEPGLTLAQAAALEAFEEGGVHGRIEENSFAQYFRRRQGDKGASTRITEKMTTVTAYLCEVLRLAVPKESNRRRTWFSVKDARRCLREGRRDNEGSEFTRVLDRAVARIRRLHRGSEILSNSRYEQIGQDRPRPRTSQQDALNQDALNKVCFEAATEARKRDASLMIYDRPHLGGIRQPSKVVMENNREILAGEVLQFAAREKRPKALGTGIKNA